MQIGFLVLRETYLKTMGCLIEACIRDGHSVSIFFDASEVFGPKAYQKVTEEKLLIFKNKGGEVVKFNINELEKLFDGRNVDVLVTHEGYHTLKGRLETVTKLRKKGIKVVSLCHFFEITAQPLESLIFFDKTYYLSAFARDLHFQLQSRGDQKEKELTRYHAQYEILGSPMFDQLSLLSQGISKREIGISEDQNVVLLFAPILSRITNWRYYIWREINRKTRIANVIRDKKWHFLPDAFLSSSFPDILKAIKIFCERSNAVLIVKSRPKQNDPDFLADMADYYIDGSDDTYYPIFSTYKLISAADVCIGVMSMGIIEAIAQSKPTINIFIPPSVEYPARHIDLTKQKRSYLEGLTKWGGPLNSEACSAILGSKQPSKWFVNRKISDLDINHLSIQQYRERILGITEQPSSKRILDSMIHLVGGQAPMGFESR